MGDDLDDLSVRLTVKLHVSLFGFLNEISGESILAWAGGPLGKLIHLLELVTTTYFSCTRCVRKVLWNELLYHI